MGEFVGVFDENLFEEKNQSFVSFSSSPNKAFVSDQLNIDFLVQVRMT